MAAGDELGADDDHHRDSRQHGGDAERSCDQPGDRSNRRADERADGTGAWPADSAGMPTGDEPEESQQRDVVEVLADRA